MTKSSAPRTLGATGADRLRDLFATMTSLANCSALKTSAEVAAASRLVDRCELAILAPSLGGVETLIEQPAVMSFHELDDEQLAEVGIEPGLIRLALGIEEAADVLADLQHALAP